MVKSVFFIAAALVGMVAAQDNSVTLTIDSPPCSVRTANDQPITDPTQCANAGGVQVQGNHLASEALFGYPMYGGVIAGQLYDMGTAGPTNRDGCQPFTSVPWPSQDSARELIVMISRGNCSFVSKVRNAQVAGADAVIVYNNEAAGNHVFMQDDGTAEDVIIPSVFMERAVAGLFKQTISNYRDRGTGESRVRATLAWVLPEGVGDKVDWSFWTTAADKDSAMITFKEQFFVPFERLGSSSQIFKPHFEIIDGRTAGCIDGGFNLCSDQCIMNGIYCLEDPEQDLQSGTSGSDVVYENLRQMCIFERSNVTGRVSNWWDYTQRFAHNCRDDDVTHNNACSETQLNDAGFTNKDIQTIRKCFADSFKTADGQPAGLNSDGSPCLEIDTCTNGARVAVSNRLLEDELQQQIDDGIFVIPTIIINGRHYRGSLSCPAPISQATCGVLNALCTAYADGHEPEACASDYCWGETDDCGTCHTAEDSYWNHACCDKTPGRVKDACGVCGGDGMFDRCGTCMSPSNPNFNQTCSFLTSSDVLAPAVGLSVGLVLVIVVVAVVVAVVLLRRKDQQMRTYVESVVSNYLPMEDEGQEAPDERLSGDDTNAVAL